MAQTTIDRLIVNSPYEEPVKHWRYDRQTRLFDLADGRRAEVPSRFPHPAQVRLHVGIGNQGP